VAGSNFGFTPGGVPDGARRRKQASTRLLYEWSLTQPWIAPPVYEQRLGPTPLLPGNIPVPPTIAAMLSRSNRYADLLGVTATQILVVEAKMVATPGAISQVLHYVNLVYQSAIKDDYPLLMIQPVLVWAVDDPLVHQQATSQGIRVDVFAPAWAAEYLNSRYQPKPPAPASEPGTEG
jgi:hypothetical protein